MVIFQPATVDGRNPAPLNMWAIPLFTWFYRSQVVVWDFFHQRYVCIVPTAQVVDDGSEPPLSEEGVGRVVGLVYSLMVYHLLKWKGSWPDHNLFGLKNP